MTFMTDISKAILLFLYVLLGNAITIGIVRHVGGELHPFQIFFTISVVALLCFAPWFIKHRRTHIKSEKMKLLWLRGFLEFVAFSASFYAIGKIPLPMHTALLFITPIFGTLIALFVLREQGTSVTYACVAIGFIGMLIITQLGKESGDLEQGYIYGVVAAIAAAMCFACCGTLIKMLTRSDSSDSIAFHMLWMTTAFSFPFAIYHWQMPALETLLWLAAAGLLAYSIQNAVGKALSKVPYITVIPLNFAQLVFVSIIAYLFFNEVITVPTLIGSLMILAATLYNAYYSSRHARRMAAKEDRVLPSEAAS